MFFSVIIPVYKAEQYLKQCIKSVLYQTYSDFELILIDDGSPDQSPQICDEFASTDERIKVIHTTNGGASVARNHGIRSSKGEYLCFIDADDYWDNRDVLTDIFETIKNENTDIIRIGLKNIRESDGSLISDPKFAWSKYKGIQKKDVIHALVVDGALKISACSVAIRRSFLVENELYFKEGIRVEDLDWAIRCYSCKPTWGFLRNNVYVSRRGRAGSVTNTINTTHLLDYLNVIRSSIDIVSGLEEDYRYPLMSYLMYQTSILISLLSNNHNLDEDSTQELDEHIKDICHRYYAKNTLDKRVKYLSCVYRIIGYKGLKKILGLYLKYRGR